MKTKTILLVTGGIVLGMLLGVLALQVMERMGQPRVDLAVGKPAPPFDLVSLDGRQTHLADFRGKAVMVNFWATWCAPCRKEMPLFEARYRQHKSNLVVIGINLGEEQTQVKGFVDEFGLTFPVLIETKGKVSSDYNVSGYPATFFIDEEGILNSFHIGEINSTQLDEALAKMGIQP